MSGRAWLYGPRQVLCKRNTPVRAGGSYAGGRPCPTQLQAEARTRRRTHLVLRALYPLLVL